MLMDRETGIEAIEKDLAALWSGFGSDPEAAPVIRACSMNMIVVAREGAEDEAHAMLERLTSEHPARVFLLTADPSASSPDVQVSARCSVPLPGEKQVCSEQITISSSANSLNRVPSLVAPLLVADVPVVLIVPDVPSDGPSGELAALSDLVIVDSADPSDLKKLAAALRSAESQSIRDLAWARTASWRTLTSLLFDIPDASERLAQINRITIHSSPAASSSAMLLKGWIRYSLEKVKAVDADVIHIDLENPEAAGHPGIIAIRFSFADSESFLVERGSDTGCAVLTHLRDGSTVHKRYLPVREADDVQHVAGMLTAQEDDAGFRHALRLAVAGA